MQKKNDSQENAAKVLGIIEIEKENRENLKGFSLRLSRHLNYKSILYTYLVYIIFSKVYYLTNYEK